jgi:sporulation protein YlmC with PRC-barrel domain
LNEQLRTKNTELRKLIDTDLDLAELGADIRGRKVLDPQGEEIGHVSALFVDEGERKVRLLEIRAGGFLGIGDRHFLLPVDAITSVGKDAVHVSETQDRVVRSPAYDPALILAPDVESWEPFFGYYGLSPYWGNGYMYPSFPMSPEETVLHDHAGAPQRDEPKRP